MPSSKSESRLAAAGQLAGRLPSLHLPAEQVVPVAQGLSQPPQCAVFTMVSTQLPPHDACPLAQPHTPAVQAAPPAHALPHMPQLPMLVMTSTQVPLQSVWP